MAFTIGKYKCYFCGRKGGFFHSVHEYGCYGEVGRRIYYHPECLEMVEVSPEKFGHIMMDKAIFVVERKKENIEKVNSKIQEEFQEKVEKLQTDHFEQMMPSK